MALFNGQIYAFEDSDDDGHHDTYQLFAAEPAFLAGMTWQDDALYVTAPDPQHPGEGQIRILQDLDDDGDALDDAETRRFVGGLPDTIYGLTFDDAGRLYVSTIADCDNCTSTILAGAVLRLDEEALRTWRLAGADLGLTVGETARSTALLEQVLHARGFHHPHDLAFSPGTSDLFAPDDGRDDLGEDAPLDELNWVQQGRDYGWPHCWPGGADPGWEVYCTWTAEPLSTFPAHSSPAGLAFHDGTEIPTAWAGNAFVALRGEGAVMRVILSPNDAGGYTSVVEPFASGLQDPIDVAVGADGALYVADFTARMIYCIRALPDFGLSWKDVTPTGPNPGDLLTYTLQVIADGPGSSFVLTDTLPPSTTCLAHTVWATAGTITVTDGQISWSAVVSTHATVTATYAIRVDPAVPTHTVLLNQAILDAADDPHSPYTLSAAAIVGPYRLSMPLIMRNG